MKRPSVDRRRSTAPDALSGLGRDFLDGAKLAGSMIELKPDECRVLGVLVEKAQTTPAQYPLSMNGIVVGCSQKSNREPIRDYSEEQAYTAIDSLTAKGLVIETHMAGSRVPKFRHNARETLNVATAQLVVFAELMLRGPQTEGELRGRASRMHPIESLESLHAVLDDLMSRQPPMVRKLPPASGSRAARFGQMLCPNLHPVGAGPVPAAAAPVTAAPVTVSDARESSDAAALSERVDRLESELARLRHAVEKMAESLGETQLLDSDA